MKQFFHKHRLGCFSVAMMIWLTAALFCPGAVWGEILSGLSLSLYADEENHPDLQFRLGIDPVKLIMVIKNETAWLINTREGFAQLDLHKSLILTDPGGTRYTPIKEGAKVFDVLPAISWNNHPTTKAEALAAEHTAAKPQINNE